MLTSRSLVVSLLLALVACGEEQPKGAPDPTPVAAPGALEEIGGHPLGAYLLNEDCFAAARDPAFVDASSADFLGTDDAVIGLESPGRVIAIPLRWIAYHRLIDLTWGQRRLLISYAPLRGTAACHLMPRDDYAHGFGIAGHLLRDLLLYDVRRRSRWLQHTGMCISGWRKGEQLEAGPTLVWTTWADWRAKHPTVQVMAPVSGMQDRYPSQARDWKKPLNPPPGLAALPTDQQPAGTATWLAKDPPPTIDDAAWADVDATAHVEDHDPVLGFQSPVGPVAVPVLVLSHHHAINARFADQDLLIALCDLCKTGAVYDATVEGARLTFDLAGAYLGAALLEDRQTRSRWSVVTGTCVFGWYRGVTLTSHDARWTHWRAWKAENPRTRVLAKRSLPEDVREKARALPADMAHTVARLDPRLPRNALVLGLSHADDQQVAARAYAYDALRANEGVAHDTWGGVPIVVFFDVGTQTATVHQRVTQNARVLTFHRDSKSQFVDDQGSTWSLSGRGIAGPAVGQQLTPLPGRATQAQWYAWSAFHPTTTVWASE